MDSKYYFPHNPGRFEKLDLFSDVFILDSLQPDSPSFQMRIGFAVLPIPNSRQTTVISSPFSQSFGLLTKTSYLQTNINDTELVVTSKSKNAFLLHKYLPKSPNYRRRNFHSKGKENFGYCASVRVGVDGRMKVKLDTRFFSHFRLGSKGKIDFSKNLQAQEMVTTTDIDISQLNISLLMSLKDDTKTGISGHFSFPNVPQLSAGVGYLKNHNNKQCRIGFRYLKKKENHEYSEPNGIAFWHDIINGAFSGIVAHRLNSYLTVALRVDGNFSSKERKAKWCCTFVGLHSKFLINQYPILVKSTFFISKEKSSSGLNIFLGTRFKNGLGVGLMTSLTRDTASLGTFFDLDLA